MGKEKWGEISGGMYIIKGVRFGGYNQLRPNRFWGDGSIGEIGEFGEVNQGDPEKKEKKE